MKLSRLSYKWVLLAFLFVTFFLAQGTRQVYNAVLPQIKIDFSALGCSPIRSVIPSSSACAAVSERRNG